MGFMKLTHRHVVAGRRVAFELPASPSTPLVPDATETSLDFALLHDFNATFAGQDNFPVDTKLSLADKTLAKPFEDAILVPVTDFNVLSDRGDLANGLMS